jgi:spore maturation protein CgeB
MEQSTGLKILFTGQFWPGANSLYIARAFERCGAVIRFLNDTTLMPGWEMRRGRIVRRLLTPLIEAEWNRQLLTLVDTFQPDLVYITNADLCWSRTVQAITKKNIPVMCFYHDVHWKDRPGSRFSENIACFDLIATTRRWQEPQFRLAGAKDVLIARFGFEPLVHRPLQLDIKAIDRYGADVTFIGTKEMHRSSDLDAMVANGFPYHFRLWGGLWNGHPAANQYWQKRPVYEQEIPIIYAASRIALHWLGWDPHSTNPAMRIGDQHNSRTFQITACGGALMLGQRTEEHCSFFEEDKEAVFFDSVQELREKLDYWLSPKRDAQRRNIADAARERCLKEDYSYRPVVSQFLKYFGFPVH